MIKRLVLISLLSILVEDSNGNRKIEEKVWCSFD